MATHCPDCGLLNPDGSSYCRKCGAFLRVEEKSAEDTTVTYKIDETGELKPVDVERVVDSEGAALVVRSGSGHVGQSFPIDSERVAIGRSPEADVFLDDVTVSRNHALIVRRKDGVYIDDLGSLNGTYINRRRIESHKLVDGDELQIGKYKLSYLAK